MKTTTDSRDFARESSTFGNPQFRAQCPHCQRMNLFAFTDEIKLFGNQTPRVVTCTHEYKENDRCVSTVFNGCGKRYVIDTGIYILATATPLIEDTDNE